MMQDLVPHVILRKLVLSRLGSWGFPSASTVGAMVLDTLSAFSVGSCEFSAWVPRVFRFPLRKVPFGVMQDPVPDQILHHSASSHLNPSHGEKFGGRQLRAPYGWASELTRLQGTRSPLATENGSKPGGGAASAARSSVSKSSVWDDAGSGPRPDLASPR